MKRVFRLDPFWKSAKLVLKYGILASVCSILLTVSVDSYFWGYTVWPEFVVRFISDTLFIKRFFNLAFV